MQEEPAGTEDDDQPLRRGRSPLFRAVALVLLVAFVLVWIPGIVDAIHVFFDAAR